MREWWANVYPHIDGHMKIGGKFCSRAGCVQYRGDFAASRIHVRLKPEGAPRRYANEHNRYSWETGDLLCRRIVQDGTRPEDIRLKSFDPRFCG
jgi:hypothetical protein